MTAPTRPALRWYGGKWKLAPWIISHLPPHRTYVEPFGGAASVLLRKDRSYAEIYNDLDDEVVNLFQVLRDAEMSAKLIEQLRLTPFARREWKEAYEPSNDHVERARRLCVISFMGFGCNSQSGYPTGFRANSSRSGTTPAGDWRNYPERLALITERLRGVVVEQRDALSVMRQHDRRTTAHYVDPPYVQETRWRADPAARERRGYRHELTDDDHAAMLQVLQDLDGMVLLSAYPHPLYDDFLQGWRRIEKATYADGARPRTEVLWLNPQACAALDASRAQIPMRFDVAAAEASDAA